MLEVMTDDNNNDENDDDNDDSALEVVYSVIRMTMEIDLMSPCLLCQSAMASIKTTSFAT